MGRRVITFITTFCTHILYVFVVVFFPNVEIVIIMSSLTVDAGTTAEAQA
jgi:hypothetical protein